MNIVLDDALKAYMQRVGKPHIIVEMITCDTSDIEISELHVFAADEKQATFFKEKKRYRSFETEVGELLLPRFPLQCEEQVRFYLKKFWMFHSIGYEGIKI